MSIWASRGWVGGGDGYDEQQHGVVVAYADGASGRYPQTDDPRAMVDFAHIPSWCVPGHAGADRDDRCDDVGPWLRLGMYAARRWIAGQWVPVTQYADVVLDEDAVRLLRDGLTAWLERGKVRP